MTEDSIAPMWAEVFECEKAVIRHCRDAVDGKRPADGGQDLALFGLAFSGGGIRSATFNLGILQAMANKRLLRRIDYLSTVSGGGYIGGWFSALLNRKAEALINPLEKEEPEKSIALAIKAVEAEIQTRPETEKEPRKPEGHAINWLRRYSNYLTPRYGVFSLDTLAAVANISRNLLLNQAILLSLLTALLLFPLMLLPLWEAPPRLDQYILASLTYLGVPVSPDTTAHIRSLECIWIFVALAFLLIFAATSVARGLNTLASSTQGNGNKDSDKDKCCPNGHWVLMRVVLPGFLTSLIVTAEFVSLKEKFTNLEGGALWWAATGAIIYCAVWSLGWLIARTWLAKSHKGEGAASPDGKWWRRWFLFLFPTIPGAAMGLMLYGCAKLVGMMVDAKHISWMLFGLGTAAVFQILSLGLVIHIGIGKRHFSEEGREWLGRIGGLVIAIQLAWTGLCLVSFYGAAMWNYLGAWLAYSGGIAWLASSTAGVLLARSEKTGGKCANKWLEVLAKITPYVFIVGLLVLLSVGTHKGLMKYAGIQPVIATARAKSGTATPLHRRYELQMENNADDERNFKLETWFAERATNFSAYADATYVEEQKVWAKYEYAIPGAMVISLLVGIFLAFRVDINLFSMHQFYRNRLTRCYLGASNPVRRGDAFTDFDPNDDLPMSRLENQRPVHLVNAALNLTKGSNPQTDSAGNEEGHLEWQQRLSGSFIFSPRHCGYRLTDKQQAYCETREYMSKEGWGKEATEGAKLGTAIAVSGAAASPNQGYHTSPPLAFIMTFFNVRLGRWCGNPKYENARRLSSPTFGLGCLLKELLCSTDDQSQFINLSDGGHFENLGLYELVRRECKLIVVCDGGCDADFEFEDLGNAVLKCRIDMGAEIEIDVAPMLEQEPKARIRFVIGRINYASGKKGVLVYVKPLLCGNEPIDVRHCATTHQDFPHQPTSDQWFDEPQFESYRQLGLLTGEELFGNGYWKGNGASSCDQWVREVAGHIK
jgi:hypothetical protein